MQWFFEMKELVYVLMVVFFIASLVSKDKKNKDAKNGEHKRTLNDEWTKNVQILGEDLSVEPSSHVTIKKEKDRDFGKNKKIDVDTLKTVEASQRDNDKKSFDAKKAIIYSAILERPYK